MDALARRLEALGPLLDEQRIALVLLVGSRAAGNARPGSDTDLAVLRTDGAPMRHRQLAELQDELSRRLDTDVDLVDLATADTLFRFEALGHGRLLRRSDRELWTALVARTLIEHADIERFLEPCIHGVGRAAREQAP